MKKIVIIGSSNTDMVIKSERLPVPGETILGGTFLMNPGGKGANQAVAVARLGGDTTFITKVGNDTFGEQSVELYKSENINTDYIFSDPELPSGIALITVDKNAENSIVVASGANMSLCPKDIEKVRTEIETADYLLMQLEIPIETVQYAAFIASQKGVKVILNPAPAQDLPVGLLKEVYMITPNKTEAEMLSGIKVVDLESAKRAADVISSKGVDLVLLTLGSDGALLKDKNSYTKIDAQVVNPIDTTAAGDVFNGAICVGLSEGKSIVEAIKYATIASAITVTKMGAQSSIPTRQEVEEYIYKINN